MVKKNFKFGDLVWAKMKGFPYWPGKIYEPSTKPFEKKHHHYVLFFGPENHAWISDSHIVPHSQSLIDNYENKKTKPGLRHAINEIAEYARSMPSTSTSVEVGPTSIADQQVSSSDDDEIDEISKPVPKKKSKAKMCNGKGKKREYMSPTTKKGKRKYKGKKRKANVLTDTDSESIPPPREYMTPTSKKIGFVGLGKIGAYIMRNIAYSGHDVTIWDLNMELLIENKFIEGVEMASSPKDLAHKCDIIFSCVAEESAFIMTLHDPTLSVTCGLDKTKGYIELTSVTEAKARDISDLIEKTGAQFLEAPVSDNIDLAEDGDLVLFASGSRDLFSSCESVFHAITKYKRYIGEEIGQANTFSVICNSLGGTISAALAESMAFADEMKVSQVDVLSGLNILGYGNTMLNVQGLNIVNGDFETASYSLNKQQKDMQMTLKMSDEVQLPMMVTAAANEVLVHTKSLKLNSDDSTAVYLATKL